MSATKLSFTARKRPPSSIEIVASIGFELKAIENLLSEACNASSACLRSVMSFAAQR